MTGSSGSEKSKWNNRDAVATPKRGWSRSKDHSVKKLISNAFAEPIEVANVTLIHGAGQLHLEGDNPFVASFDNQINFLPSSGGS